MHACLHVFMHVFARILCMLNIAVIVDKVYGTLKMIKYVSAL